MALQSIKFEDGKLFVLNQLLLPTTCEYDEINSTKDAWHSIREMKVGDFYGH